MPDRHDLSTRADLESSMRMAIDYCRVANPGSLTEQQLHQLLVAHAWIERLHAVVRSWLDGTPTVVDSVVDRPPEDVDRSTGAGRGLRRDRRRCPSRPRPFVSCVRLGDRRRAHRTEETPMPTYAAILYTHDADWTAPEHAAEMAEYGAFSAVAGPAITGGAALHPTSTATTVRVRGGRGGDVLTTDGPFAETTEVLTGFFLLDAPDLDAAVALAARIPAAWNGAVELRPVIPMGG